MMKRSAILLGVALMFVMSCRNDTDVRQRNISGELTINGLSDSLWTYFSFERGAVVGSSRYCDDAQDAQWAARKDWDFAICGDDIKTNSGESGNGEGGVQRNTTESFVTLETAPEEGYLTDRKVRVK